MATVMNHAIRRYLSTTAARGVRVEGPSAVSGGHEGNFLEIKILLFVSVTSRQTCYITDF